MNEVALKRVCSLVTDPGPEEERASVALEHIIGGTGRIGSDVELPRRRPAAGLAAVQPGDVLFGKLRPYLAKTLRVREPMFASTELLALRPKSNTDARWLHYLVMSDRVVRWAVATSDGSKMPRTSWSVLGELRTTVPDLRSQRAIADYLDAETARIDALIEKKRRLVGLLRARFQLEIDHTMDGVASSEAALGRFVLDLSQGSSPQAAGYTAKGDEWGVLKLSAVKFGRYDPQENKAMTEEPDDLTMIPRVGDLLVTRSNTPALVGDVAAVAHTAPRRMLPDLIYRVRLDKKRISAEFVAYVLLTSRSRHEISSLARGSSQSMVKLRGEDIRSLPVPVVTPALQEQIVKSLERRREQTSETLTKLNRQIELLTEHRQALITAAVTGQLEVAGAAVR